MSHEENSSTSMSSSGMAELVTSVQWMFVGAGALAALLLLALAVWCWWSGRMERRQGGRIRRRMSVGARGQWPSSSETMLRREQLESGGEEDDKMWRCAVCAYANMEHAATCVMCGTGQQGPLVLVLGQDEEHAAEDESDLDLQRRQRALMKRKMNSRTARLALSQRQRGAFRRRMWMRKKSEDGHFRWTRRSTEESGEEYHYVAMSDENENENARDEDELKWGATEPQVSCEVEDQGDMSKCERTKSQGFVSLYDDRGRLQWQQADEVAIDMTSFDDLTNSLTKADDEPMDLEGVTALDFRPKKQWFLVRLSRLATPAHEVVTKVTIRRDHLLEDSVQVLTACPTEALHTYLKISFPGEPGIDAGGLLREWFALLCKDIFGAELGLFVPTKGEDTSYWINPLSSQRNPRHLEYFRLAGILVGKALFEGLVMDVHLGLPLLKHVLGVPISFSDLEFLDEELHRNCEWVARNTNVEMLALTFSIMLEDGTIVDLKENGRHIDVTDSNKMEYLQLVLKQRMLASISEQLQYFLTGLYDVVPKSLLSVFDYQELELMLCGVPTIDPSDWCNNTHVWYLKGPGIHCSETQQQRIIEWFWNYVNTLSAEECARLLQFATGTSRLPIEGFRGLTSSSGIIHHFTIQFVPRGKSHASLFPKAHTCFNRIDLPLYHSPEELETYLSAVLEMEILGFGLE